MQPKVTANRKTARPKKPEPKPTAAPKPVTGKLKKKEGASVKTAAAKPATPNLVASTQSPTSPLVEISDILNHLPSKYVWKSN